MKCPSEHALYKRGTSFSYLLMGVYVDDLIIVSSIPQEIQKFKEEMKKLFEMSDLGLLSYYLGLEVHQSTEGITIGQSAYALKILELKGWNEGVQSKSGAYGCKAQA